MMSDPALGMPPTVVDDPDVRLPLWPSIGGLVALAIGLGFVESLPEQQVGLVEASLMLLLVAVIGSLTALTSESASRLIVAVGLASVLAWASYYTATPSLVCLAPVVVAFAGALLGTWGATAVASLITGWVWVGKQSAAPETAALAASSTAAAWAMVILALATYSRLRGQLLDASRFVADAQGIVAHARDRQLELAQALDSVAHLNRQLVLTTQRLDEAKAIAENAQKLKADFVARVSHELRTPLNMIVGFAEMIMEAPQAYGPGVPQALLADLAIILRNSRHLGSLVDDVLDLSRIEAGQMAITRERTDLGDVIAAAADVVRPLFESKRLYLRVACPSDLPQVYCDPLRIRETVVNLLSNAGRFTEEGGVTVTVERDEGDVIVAVRDTGPGIDPDAGKQLFQPFQQLEDAMRRRHAGTGLGLAISRSFVRLHGGRMWFESQVDRGTTFSFSLPIDPPEAPSPSAVRWIEPTWEYRRSLPRPTMLSADLRLRLLVVEEGHSLARLLTRYLDNVEVLSATSIPEAAETLRESPVQGVLVNAPSVGPALEAAIASELGGMGAPVIVCSVPELNESSAGLGVDQYVLKPVSREQLCAALDQVRPEGRTILVVDDEPEELRMFWRMLVSSGRGYRVLTANDGEKALAAMRQYRPDAVLLDLVMPRMDGFQVLDERSRDPALRDIPVIVLTALDPSSQPIVSSSLAVTHGSGLSVGQFLHCIEGLSRLLGTPHNGSGRP